MRNKRTRASVSLLLGALLIPVGALAGYSAHQLTKVDEKLVTPAIACSGTCDTSNSTCAATCVCVSDPGTTKGNCEPNSL